MECWAAIWRHPRKEFCECRRQIQSPLVLFWLNFNNLWPFVVFFVGSQILATFTNGSLTQLPNNIAAQRSGTREVNKRIRQAMEVRSSERMRKEHITTFTQVFKDSHVEGKVTRESFFLVGFFGGVKLAPWKQSLIKCLSLSILRWETNSSNLTWFAPSFCCCF